MESGKMFCRRNVFIILLLAAVSISVFLAGALAYKYGFHHKIPCLRNLIGRIKEKSRPPFFYPAPRQEIADIFQERDAKYPFTFIVYGDSREPAGYEKDALIARIVIEKPSFVLHLGDMVLYGGEHQWKIFDLFDGRIMNHGIPFYPVLGNHEYHAKNGDYSPQPEEQLWRYFDRFKFLNNRRWYSFKYGNSSFVILDTNTDYSQGSHQHEWLINMLKEDPPKFLFVAFHRPPYTKNKDKALRKSERFLADTFEGYADKGLAKADIVFSGHVHNYERYKHNGINYVVSGGGGAPQHPIERAAGDFYAKTGDAFHYCKITVSETEVTLEMIELNKDGGKWVVADTFTVSK